MKKQTTRDRLMEQGYLLDVMPIVLNNKYLRENLAEKGRAQSVAIYWETFERRVKCQKPRGHSDFSEIERLIATCVMQMRGADPQATGVAFNHDSYAVDANGRFATVLWRCLVATSLEEGVRCVTIAEVEL